MPRNYYVVNKNRFPFQGGIPPGDFTKFLAGSITPTSALTKVLGGPPPPQNFVRTTSGLLVPHGTLTRTLITPPPGGFNEPAGFRRIVECSFSDDPKIASTTCSSANMIAGTRGILASAIISKTSRVNDPLAPKSPQAVWDVLFPAGQTVGGTLGGWMFWETCQSPRPATYLSMYTRSYINFWGDGNGTFECIHSGGIKIWFYQTNGHNINIFLPVYITGSGPPEVRSAFYIGFVPPVWNADGTLKTNAGVIRRTTNQFQPSRWYLIESLITCNSLPAGGSDANPVNDATYKMWIDGVLQPLLNPSTGVSSTTSTGFRTRTYALPGGFHGNWWGIVYGGGQAGSKQRNDHIRFDHHYVSVGAAA